MRILMIAPDPRDGTSNYRAMGPFGKMAKMYPDVTLKMVAPGETIGWDTLSDVDIVFMQRPFDRAHVSFAKKCNDHKVPLVVDYDDNYFDIKEDNPAYWVYDDPDRIETLRYLVELADEAWFGTTFLQDVMKSPKTPSVVIENGIDLDMFPPQLPKFRNCVVWRGGASHDNDLKLYKKEIFQLIDKFEDHEFVFMGYCPEWISDHIDPKRFRQVRFSPFPVYMRILMELAPKCIIMPLEDTEFNKSRGDSAFLEGGVAGCPVVAPVFVPSFDQHPDSAIYKYNDREYFYYLTCRAIEYPNEVLVNIIQNSLTTTKEVAIRRYNRLKDIVKNYDATVKPNDIDNPIANADQEYLDTFRMGVNLHNKKHKKNVKGIVDNLMKEFDIKSVLDVGCGNGSFLAEFLRREDVVAHGVDLNPHWKKEWDEKFPEAKGYFINMDFGEVKFDTPTTDLIMCVEVMEHLDDKTVHKWVKKFSQLGKWVIFTSVPYSEGPAFDKYWGHQNLKPTNHWVQIFKKYGFTLVRKQQPPAIWGMLFINTNL